MQTFTRLYDGHGQAERAVRDLEAAGISSEEISLVSHSYESREDDAAHETTSATASGAGIGAAMGGSAGLLAGLGLLAIPGLGPVVAAGWLAATAVGALAGSTAGGLIGALVDAGTPEAEAHLYSEAVRRGGSLVIVRTDHSADAIAAILDHHRPVETGTRRADYEKGGWTEFYPKPTQLRQVGTLVEAQRRAG